MSESAVVAETPKPVQSNAKKKVLFLLIIVALIGGGVGVWYFLQGRTPDASAKAQPKQAPKPTPIFVALDVFTVNLQDDGFDRYLQVDIVVQVTGAEVADVIKAQLPILRSAIIEILSSKQSDPLIKSEGKQQLAQEIATRLRKQLALPGPNNGIENVHFASFVIQ